MHWNARNRLQKGWHALVMEAVRKQGIEPVEDYLVNIQTRVIYKRGDGKRRLDPGSVDFVGKMIIDQLQHDGIIENDSPLYVHEVRNGPCLWGDEHRIETIITEGVADPE